MWQVNCENVETRDALLRVARENKWIVTSMPNGLIVVVVDDHHVDCYFYGQDAETVPLYEAFALLSIKPIPVAVFSGFVIPMTLENAKKVLNDIYIIDCVVETMDWCGIDPLDIEAELREFGAWVPGDLDRQRITWIAACKIMCDHYLGDSPCGK